ncbi:hypothetical protein M885DRAFT_616938 [Pelagophyceae sp. CCMP2097]|nr:hypothetical protein M885DRAFT_616938 [Pelagophyceae sp. CCMP2097]
MDCGFCGARKISAARLSDTARAAGDNEARERWHQPVGPARRRSWPLAGCSVVPYVAPSADADAAQPPARRDVAARWRVPVAFGLLFASWLGIASVIGLLDGEKSDRAALDHRKDGCRGVRDSITEWGKRLSVEASTFGWLMLRERDMGISPKTPFLVPGPLASALQFERLARMADEFAQTPPIMIWYPTVRFEDRAAYEAYASELYGMHVNVTDSNPGTSDETDPLRYFSNLTAAPPRPFYDPITFVWTVGDPVAASLIRHRVGFDVREWLRCVLPPAVHFRFFDERRLVAHPLYLANGKPLVDYALNVRVPIFDEACGAGCDAKVLGSVSFSLRVDSWESIFPAHLGVTAALTGHVIKTPASSSRPHRDKNVAMGNSNSGTHVHIHESFLDLNLECYQQDDSDADSLGKRFLTFLVFLAILIIVLLLALLRRLELGAARERQMVDERRKDAARDAAAAEQCKDERLRYAFEMSEKTERYLNHELKNRIFVLGQSCAAQSLHGQIDEIAEVLNSKAVLMRLSTGRYEPSWDAVESVSLIDTRWQRFVAANSPFERVPTTGAAAHRRSLRLDKVLFNIILDNILSNAFKYGDPSRPPSLSLNIDPVDDGATRVRLSLELRNWAGPEHEALLEMGEAKLNEIAHAEGRRAHEHAAELSSGDGFPMAAAAASALGGTVRLVLLPDGVLAKLELPDVAAVLPGSARFAAVPAAPVELSWLKIAMVDDSASFRKTFARLSEKVTSQEPFVAGATRESIDDFPKAVVERDCDVVLLDFNFAPTHHTKTGVDLCRECRQLDAEEGNAPRLIFIVSANDSPEDAERYRAAGADGSLGKKMSVATLRQVLEDAVQTHPRFAARRGDASDLVVKTDSWRCLQAVNTQPPSPGQLADSRKGDPKVN